ncbi:MAG: ferritin family protein [Alphaproteobacteria bacterium]|nr:ferritin family protein [Alphaproteobacteria bacterium]
MNATATATGIATLPELLAHALAIEVEAEERYALLADQMEVHNNPQLATLFRKLSEIEGRHARQIEQRAAGLDLPEIAPWDYRWDDADSPESIDMTSLHYLMTPHHALRMALAAEERAARFFERLVETADNEDVKNLAAEFAEEERAHVNLVRELLARHPEPDSDWDEDMDPPVLQE